MATTKDERDNDMENGDTLYADSSAAMDSNDFKVRAAWNDGFYSWVNLEVRPDLPLQAAGWDAAAQLNEAGGNRPTVLDAAEANPHTV